MNNLMEIKKYDDIVDVELAGDGDAKAFAKGKGSAPKLEPLYPYFGRGFRKHPWNKHLEELFIQHYKVEMRVDLDVEAEDTIGDMFIERIERLRRRYKTLTKEESASDREARAEEVRSRGKQNTRRVNVSLP